MQSLTRILETMRLALLVTLTAGLALQPVHAAPGGKGGGGGPSKVTVTAADPREADQGAELDVTITGDGFDAGSAATFYVSGTSDDSQITVLSNSYDVNTGQLKSRIRVNGAALVSEYDIEVRNSSGRRGKGTTLFRVKSVGDECSLVSADPEIVYLTAPVLSGDLETQDIQLSSASGCDQYPLVEDVVVRTPMEPKTQSGHVYSARVDSLKVDILDSVGIVAWRDSVPEERPIMAAWFTVLSDGSVVPDPSGPFVLHVPPAPARNATFDIRLVGSADQVQIELAVVEVLVGYENHHLVYRNPQTNERKTIADSECSIVNQSGECFIPLYHVWWNEQGDRVYFKAITPDFGVEVIADVQRQGAEWRTPEVLISNSPWIDLNGVRFDDTLAYRVPGNVNKKNGGPRDEDFIDRTIHPDLCRPVECDPSSGDRLSINFGVYPKAWTKAGGLIFMDRREQETADLFEYVDPYTGEIGGLELRGVGRNEWDTSY